MSFLSHLDEYIINILILEKHNSVEREKIRFGVKLVLNDLWKVIIVYLIAFFLKVVIATLLTHLIFFVLRQVCFGFHFQNGVICLITSVFSLPIVIFFIRNWNSESHYLFFLAIASTLILLIFAPIGTKKRPVFSEKHKSYLRKKLFIRLIIIWIILLVLNGNYQEFIFYAIILIAVSVITQKLQGAIQ